MVSACLAPRASWAIHPLLTSDHFGGLVDIHVALAPTPPQHPRFHMRDAKWELFLSSSEDLFTNELHTLPLDAQADRLSAIILQAAHLSFLSANPMPASIRTVGSTVPGLRKSTTVLMPLANSSVATLPLPPAATSKTLFAMHRQSRPASAAMLSSIGARISLPTHPSDVCGDAFGPYTPLVLLRCPLILLQLRKPKDWPNFSLPALP
ncbi:hypothetical protein GWK47_025430 [Chionoecetes opilio]|uniref:Uncharacterized protein n=1 Tax=Chionoecetes opilio TaxID=41210 RepID=A0A8J8WN47_CHIOP|nr:hypothetical protein GWK47_025430 [Chionoecetes opilio]